MIRVTNARFVQSCERFAQAPSILGAEIAILGRSNVGKSSLINALLNHKNLAKSSATPGKTRLINFFSAKWRVDSAESQNLGGNISSLRNFAKQSCGKPPIEKTQYLQGGWLLRNARKSFGLPRRFCESARNDEILDSSLRKCSAQNDKNKVFAESNEKIKSKPFKSFCYFWLLPKVESSLPLNPNLPNSVDSAESQNLQGGWLLRDARKSFGLPRRFCESARNDEILDSSLRKCFAQNDKNKDFAESGLDSAIPTLSTQDANSSIVDEFLRSCEVSDADRTNGSSRKRGEREREKSPQDAEFAEFEIRILDFPGFGYARVSKAEKSSWDRHLSEFLHKRDSIKLYLHLIDARHQNLELDNEIFAFLNRFKRGDCAILQVFTKADKLSKNELARLKKQHKFYHAINDKNSTEILRCAILKILYNVDF